MLLSELSVVFLYDYDLLNIKLTVSNHAINNSSPNRKLMILLTWRRNHFINIVVYEKSTKIKAIFSYPFSFLPDAESLQDVYDFIHALFQKQ